MSVGVNAAAIVACGLVLVLFARLDDPWVPGSAPVHGVEDAPDPGSPGTLIGYTSEPFIKQVWFTPPASPAPLRRPELPELELLAIGVFPDGSRRAMIHDPERELPRFYSEGAKIGPVVILEIADGAVVCEAYGERITLTTRKSTK